MSRNIKTESSQLKNLNALKPGDSGLLSLSLTGMKNRRLSELGMINGTEVKLMRKAPFGGPMEIALRHTRICLRQAEAQEFFVITGAA